MTSSGRLVPRLFEHRGLYLLLLPGTIYLVLMCYLPMFGAVVH
jgi:ABC-type polysaccharide transport system permease subunit